MSENQSFRYQLVSELTQLDARESRRERITNIYRLGHYLGAADDMIALMEDREGVTAELAFMRVFTATRGMHTVAKRLGLALDVQRGEWVAL